MFFFVFVRSSCLGSQVHGELNVKASLIAVLLAVVDVVAVNFALDAELLLQGEVGEVDGHQRLQVSGVQPLAVVGVVLEGETGDPTEPEVLDLSDLAFVFFPLWEGITELALTNKQGSPWFCKPTEVMKYTDLLCSCSEWG